MPRGVDYASTRQKTSSKRSYDSSRVVKTPKGDEDRHTYDELMGTCANIAQDVANQKKQIDHQGELITKQGETIKSQGEVIENQKKE